MAPPSGPDVLVVATEASGDLHGARLVRALSPRLPGARFVGMGGEQLRAAGLEALYDTEELSVMGFVEVVPKLAKAASLLQGLARWAEARRPAVAILIDDPDFNLRLARELRLLGIPVVYLIAPMVWAWREGRVRLLRDVDRVLCIYPFEEPWFRRRGVAATYVGNPLLEDPTLASLPDRASCRAALGIEGDGQVVALLPGSRRAEIAALLPLLLDAAERLAEKKAGLRFVLPVASAAAGEAIDEVLRGREGVALHRVEGRTPEVLRAADAAAICSGTATLQAALALCPTVMIYRAHPLSIALARVLVRLEHACITNILLGRGVIPELLQDDCQPDEVAERLLPLLDDSAAREAMIEPFRELRAQLGGGGYSDRAAEEILAVLAAEAGQRLLPTGARV